MSASRREACEVAPRRGAARLIERAQIPAGGWPMAPFDDPEGYSHRVRHQNPALGRQWSDLSRGAGDRAILVAERRLGDARFRAAALVAGEFMLRERLDAPAEIAGMLLTYMATSR